MTGEPDAKLLALRAKLDKLDSEILTLLAQRFQVIEDVARYKRTANVAVMQTARVVAVLLTRSEHARQLGLNPAFITRLWEIIIAESCQIEQNIVEIAGCSGAATSWRSVVLGASGGVGRLLSQLINPHVKALKGFDLRGGENSVVADVLSPSDELRQYLAQADLIVIALPDKVACQAVKLLSETAAPDSLVVDTCLVKTPMAEAWKDRGQCEILLINPLFGPDLDIYQKLVASVRLRAGLRTEVFEEWLSIAGAKILPMSVDQHDRASAIHQALVHAVLLVFSEVFSCNPHDVATSFSTPSSALLASMAARMLHGDFHMHWRIQSDNPWA